MNMRQWVKDQIALDIKKPLPILSFPATQLLNITVAELISNSGLQAQGMKAVADRCPAAAAVSLMDLSVEAEAFGAEIRVTDDEVPTVIGHIINSEADARALAVPAVGAGRTGLYIEAIAQARQLITDRPVLAGVIGPFSLSGRLIGMTEIMVNCYTEPELVHATLEKAAAFITDYIKAYKAAGAQGVVVAEPAAGLLSAQLMVEFSGNYMKTIIAGTQSDDFAVFYHNCGNSTSQMTKELAELGAMGYHFGNAVNMREMLEKMPDQVLVMGNLSPADLFRGGNPQLMQAETLGLLEDCRGHANFTVSSGCDIPPASSWDNIDAFFAAVNAFYHS